MEEEGPTPFSIVEDFSAIRRRMDLIQAEPRIAFLAEEMRRAHYGDPHLLQSLGEDPEKRSRIVEDWMGNPPYCP